jgi:hypothetical protein
MRALKQSRARLFIKLLELLFFKRNRALVVCVLFSAVSYFVERELQVQSFFANSGTVFTLAGLFLSIKNSMKYHLKIDDDSKVNYIANVGFIFRLDEPTEETIQDAESVMDDEIYGTIFMVVGTLLWGYGGYAFNFLGG